MLGSSPLDRAIESSEPVGGYKLRVQRIIERLHDSSDLDRLLDMLRSPIDEWPHRQMANILQLYCEEVGVNHEDVTAKNVEVWRKRQHGGS